MLARDKILPHTIAGVAAEEPGLVCLEDVSGRRLTYAQLHENVLRWAAALRLLDVQPGDRVLTMFPNGFESFEVWLGVAWLRALEVPINTAHRGHSLEYLIENSRAKVLVIAERFLPQLAEAGNVDRLDVVVVPDLSAPTELAARVVAGDELFAGVEPAADLDGPAHYDIACLIYTSGTTGPSKGVLVPWAELFEFPAATPPDAFGSGLAYYACLPTFHVGGKSTLYTVALHRGRAVLREVFSLSEFWGDIERSQCSTTGLIGVMAQLLLAMPEQPGDAENSLTIIQTGPLFPEVDEFERRFGVRVFTGYGMTEIGAPLYVGADERVDWRSCGRIREGYEIRIVDEYDEPVSDGAVGELIIRSDEPWRLNAGYFEMPDATARAWRNGWFHTGDGFRRDEQGNYYFVDRLKDAMRKGGENISSLEVEGFVREYPGVLEAAAIAAPSEFGPGEDEVKVLVVRKPDHEFTEKELLDFLRPRMAKFMHPRYVEFVAELPKTPTQRVRKVELRADALNARTWDRVAGGYCKG